MATDSAASTAATSSDNTLGNYPIVTDFLHNLIMIAGTFAASFAGGAGSLVVQVAGIAAVAAGLGLSAVHVSKTSWFGKLLGTVQAQQGGNVPA
jgi:hypothetical protein